MKYLVEVVNDINKKDKYDDTPLFDACLSGNLKMVEYLVEKGADINKDDQFDKIPLYSACEYGQENIIK